MSYLEDIDYDAFHCCWFGIIGVVFLLKPKLMISIKASWSCLWGSYGDHDLNYTINLTWELTSSKYVAVNDYCGFSEVRPNTERKTSERRI